jgi:hypothetical protein
MLRLSTLPKLLVSVPVALGALWTIAYFMGLNSESYKFVKQRILTASSVAARVGPIKDVRLPFFGQFRDTGGGWVSMEVDALGERGAVRVDVELRHGPTGWVVTRAAIGDEAISL